MKLDGKTAIVTGGSKGIGFGIARLLSEEGANVIIIAKNKKRLERAKRELGNVYPIPCNIKSQDQIKGAIKETIKKFGRIDILVNNAGIFPKFKPMHKITEEEWNEVIDVNLTGQFRFTKAVIPIMIKKGGGSIINISSDAGLKAFENFKADAYTASKGAIVLLTKAWALEYAKYDIRVNCVCAAVVETEMTKKLWLSTNEKRKYSIKEHPLGRIGNVNDIAKTVLYFASDDSSWTTGAILPVDGGVSIK